MLDVVRDATRRAIDHGKVQAVKGYNKEQITHENQITLVVFILATMRIPQHTENPDNRREYFRCGEV